MLGVSPATVRRWSDAGRLRVFTTPGGHRRFSRDAIGKLLPGDSGHRPSIAGAGLTSARLARTYRRFGRDSEPTLPWLVSLTDAQRALFRDRGRVLAATLLQHLDAATPDAAGYHLEEASRAADDYGRVAAQLGLSLSRTVEGFLRFRAPFHHELTLAARRRGFDTGQTTDLLEAAEQAMDTLLIATMAGHGARGPRQAPKAATKLPVLDP
jgi:excisionase family DNA binding protein